jgi:Holliday junction resolvase RusA-like endonuclease
MIEFTIPGDPQGKARAKVFKNKYTGNSHGVTPEKTVLYENLIKTIFIQTGYPMIEEKIPLLMVVNAHYGISKSTSKKDRLLMSEHSLRPTKKPDVDNIVKVVADALNGIAYHDDSQIVNVVISKWYSENPRVEVKINQI